MHRSLRRLACLAPFAIALAAPSLASADNFAAGSLIVPMDTDYQDSGMLEAYGLVYELLRNGVPVRWVIKGGKAKGGVDFTVAATDVRTMNPVPEHGYRGGPWVIDSADAGDAKPIIDAWLTKNPNTNVHAATAGFTGDVSRLLVVAPTIAMMADGNQKIARKYMMAAKIPDSTLNPLWPDASPDMLDPTELAGTPMSHHDGALFDEDGDPVYCQFMSMHWGVNNAAANPEVVAEMRDFLGHPTHFFAECQAVNAFENLDPYGYFLTNKGFLISQQPKSYDFLHPDEPFTQLDGAFASVGGSEPSYSLPMGESYKAVDVVFITKQGTPVGDGDVWMTGFLDGLCPGGEPWSDPLELAAAGSGGGKALQEFWLADRKDYDFACLTNGKVSYLGGHEYSVNMPISANPTSQGARLFLNSLFEAPCATAEGLPTITLQKDAPAVTDTAQVTFTIDYVNEGPITVLDAVLKDTLPPGSTYVDSSPMAMVNGDEVTWSLGNLGVAEGGQVTLTVELGDFGKYENVATLDYRLGLNGFMLASNKTSTLYGVGDTTGGDTDATTGTGTAGTDTTGVDTAMTDSGGTDTTGTGTAGTDSAGTDTVGTTSASGSASASSTDGTSAGTGGSASGTGATNSGSGSSAGSESDTASASASGTGDSATGSGGETGGSGDESGCGCRSDATPPTGLLVLFAAVALRRRRGAA